MNWGMIQIQGLTNTYFRFDLKDGVPILDESFFVDKINDTDKHKILNKNSTLYKDIQKKLDEYFLNIKKSLI